MTLSAIRRTFALSASALLVLACDQATPPIPAASVVIDQLAPYIVTGGTLQFTGSVLDASGNVLVGRALTWKSSDTTRVKIASTGLATWFAPGAVSVIATSGSAADTVLVTAGGDFAIANVVITQGVQDALGTIPMIKNGGAAAVLVMLTTQGPVTAAMKVTLNLLNAADNSLAYTTSGTVSNLITTSATSAAPTIALLVPAAQIKSNLKWQVLRDPDGDAPDDSLVNDSYPRAGAAALSVYDVPALNIHFLPIVLTNHGDAQPALPEGTIPGYLQSVKSMLPIGQVNTTTGAPFLTAANFGVQPSSGGPSSFWQTVLAEVELARSAAVGVDPTAHWYGVVSPPSGYNFVLFGGYAYLGNPNVAGAVARTALGVRTGWFFDQAQAMDLVAHELGHNFGRSHAPCGNPANPDVFFPRPNGTIGEVMHRVFYWSGLTSSIGTMAASSGDIMSYCGPKWASTYTYNGVTFGRGPGVLTGPVVAAAAAGSQSAEDVIAIQGSVRLDGRALPTLLPTVQFRGRRVMPATAGAFRLVGFDAMGVQLFDYPFAPMQVAEEPGLGHFTFVLPHDAETQRLARIRVSGPTGSAELSEPLNGVARTPIVRRTGGRLVADCGAGARLALQDETTGELLGISGNGSLSISSQASRVAVSCALGVQSSRRAFVLP